MIKDINDNIYALIGDKGTPIGLRANIMANYGSLGLNDKIFYVDIAACIGCRSCETACKQQNDLPAGIQWRKIVDWEGEIENKTALISVPIFCQHCDDPPCVKVCPRGALRKRPQDGIVESDTDRCIGCRFCMWVCPFGAIQVQAGKVQKCSLCIGSQEAELLPACVESCPVSALHFDTISEISKLINCRISKAAVRRMRNK